MTRVVEIIVFVISTQWRAFSTQFCLTLVQESLTYSGGGAYWRFYGSLFYILKNVHARFPSVSLVRTANIHILEGSKSFNGRPCALSHRFN